MGNNPSKPTEHIFYGETPVQFSHNLVNTLEGSSESDSTRKKSSDLHIAQLVNSELQRLQSREDDILSKLPTSPDSSSTDTSAPLSISAAVDQVDDPITGSRNALASKIAEIKSRLENAPGASGSVVGEEDEEIKRVRGDMVRCLRVNDRRPLVCWKEVEAFKEVARRREKGFVTGLVGK